MSVFDVFLLNLAATANPTTPAPIISVLTISKKPLTEKYLVKSVHVIYQIRGKIEYKKTR